MKRPLLSLALVLMTPLISFADIGDLTREASDIRQRIVNFDATKPEQDRMNALQSISRDVFVVSSKMLKESIGDKLDEILLAAEFDDPNAKLTGHQDRIAMMQSSLRTLRPLVLEAKTLIQENADTKTFESDDSVKGWLKLMKGKNMTDLDSYNRWTHRRSLWLAYGDLKVMQNIIADLAKQTQKAADAHSTNFSK